LAYAPKRLYFDVDYYMACVCLTILDHKRKMQQRNSKRQPKFWTWAQLWEFSIDTDYFRWDWSWQDWALLE